MRKAKFRYVADIIKQRVDDGEYGTKQKLPSEYDLADEFQVSRLTVRKAIALLIESQVLVKSQGKGTYVIDAPKIESGRLGLQGFTEASQAYGRDSHTEVISYAKVSHPSKNVLDMLQINKNHEVSVYRLVRCRYWDNEPMTVEQIYIPEPLVKGLSKKDFTGSLFKIIEKQEKIAYSQQEIEAVLAKDHIGKLLYVSVGGPILKVQSVTYTAEAKPIFLDTSYYRADKYRFKTTLIRHKL